MGYSFTNYQTFYNTRRYRHQHRASTNLPVDVLQGGSNCAQLSVDGDGSWVVEFLAIGEAVAQRLQKQSPESIEGITKKFPKPQGKQQWSAAAPGLKVQQFRCSNNPIRNILIVDKIPIPAEYLNSKFKIVVWWPDAEHASLRGTVCCKQCKQSTNVTHYGWMAKPCR